jgi:hypothetical protein
METHSIINIQLKRVFFANRFDLTFDIMSGYICESMLKNIHAVSGCGTCPGIMIWRRKQRPQMPQ